MRPALQRLLSTIAALTCVLGTTLVCFRLAHANSTVAALALMLTVLLIGTYGKTAEAILASFAATLCLDYFFVPPIGSITIGDPEGWIALMVFLTVALIATHLARRLRWQRDQLIAQHKDAERLYALNRAMLFGNGEDVHRLIVNKCIELFRFREVVLFDNSTGRIYRSGNETAVADEVLRRVACEPGLESKEQPGWHIIPISLGNKTLGSFGYLGEHLPEASLQALGNTIAVGLAQAQAQETASHAEVVRQSEELKSVMIDALAHDLKTPLTSIEAAADMLLHPGPVRSEQRRDLLEVIQQESKGLRRMVNEAIHLARIDATRLKLNRQAITVRELVGAATALLGSRVGSHEVIEQIPEDLPSVLVDRELMAQALKQILDNAVKYSPSRSPIVISASDASRFVSISIRDKGPGLTELEQAHVFDKFYRGRYGRSSVQGTGMGLAITKEIVEAHGGSAGVESQIGQGSRFTIALPAENPADVSAGAGIRTHEHRPSTDR